MIAHKCKLEDKFDDAWCENDKDGLLFLRIQVRCCGCADIIHYVTFCPVCGFKGIGDKS